MVIVTASQLYDYVNCPRRVELDLFGNDGERDPVSPFVRLLWERGSSYEERVIRALPPGSYVSIKQIPLDEREAATLDAIQSGAPLIYGGRIASGELLGDPDLLIKRGEGYLAADIKSGQGEEGDSDEGDGRPKPHYAVQVALYTDILERLGIGCGHLAEIWDGRGEQVSYDLDQARHSRTAETWWGFYKEALRQVTQISEGSLQTKGALAAQCKLCHWGTHCRAELTAAKDLTLVPYLGRALRDAAAVHFFDLSEFASANPDHFIVGKKTTIAGLGPDRFQLFQERAKMLCDPDAKPYLRAVVSLPQTDLEIFFDIEADPMNDIVYLHGFLERRGGDPATEVFTYFFADGDTAEAEREAFAQAIGWLLKRQHAAVYYYSKYERTMYRKLCQRHPEICPADEIEALFTPPRAVDLYYDVVYRATEWPTHDHSIKTLAKYLGFSWRDADPSGAASIEWYQRWIESGDLEIRKRIIDYNEDDCRATAVLLDGIRRL
jgi:predicted RecB family nuclease